MFNTNHKIIDLKSLSIPIFLSVLLILSNQISFLFFHTMAELFAIIVAILACVVAWQTYSFTRNHFLMYLGCGYFWVGVLDMMHAMTFKGINIMPITGSEITVQYWLVSRYLEAFLLVTAPLFLSHVLNRKIVFSLFGLASVGLIYIVTSNVLPTSYVEGKGLTNFKIISEYAIICVLMVAAIILFRKKNLLDQQIFSVFIASIFLTMAAELAFTVYVSMFGLSMLVGHILKLFSFWLIFLAIVKTTLRDPFSAMSKAETYYDAVPDASIILNKNGIIQHVNRSACELVNSHSVELIGSHVHKLFHNAETSINDCPVCVSIKDGKELCAFELLSNEEVWFDYSTSQISGENSYVQIIRDISTKKNMALALEKSQEHLSITLNSIADAVIVTDERGLITHMNPVAEQITGWYLKDATRKNLDKVFSIIDPKTKAFLTYPINKIIRDGERIRNNAILTLKSRNGAEYHITDSAAPIFDSNKILGMVLVFTNATERHRLREEAVKSKRDLQAVMDNSPAVIYIKDTLGRYMFINKRYEELFHIERKEIVGRTDLDLFPKEIAKKFQDNDKIVIDLNEAHESEEIAPHEDGLHTYISVKFPLLSKNDEVYAVCGISTDITDRKRAEEKLKYSESRWRAISENSPTHVMLLNKDLNILFINRTVPDLTKEEVIGRYQLDFVPPNYKDIVIETAKNVFETGKPDSYLIEYRTKEEETRYFQVWVGPIFEDGKVVAMVSSSLDITEGKLAEETMRRTQKMDALGKLSGGIAHDYNNLLGIIQGYADLIEEKIDKNSNLHRYANEIQRAAQRGTKLTKKLLSFSQLKAPDATVLDMNILLRSQQLMLEKTLTARIRLVYDLEDNLWSVDVDSSDLENSIVNMSINAMHAMSDGGELTIQTRNESLSAVDASLLNVSAGDYVLLNITDTGCGMDEKTLDKIFDPFYTTKGEKGTGLGLSQVFGFVERSKGAIRVYSEPNHGSCFSIYLPRTMQTISNSTSLDANITTQLNGNESLLIVDDEKAMVDLAYDILSNHGYHVLTANDGNEALDVLKSNHVDMVISDVIMPNMDGYIFVDKLLAKYPNMKVQMVSGFTDDRHTNSINNSLFKTILFKPYSSNTLLKRVRQKLDENTPKELLKNKNILLVDDDEDIQELFKVNLKKLGCHTIPVSTGEKAIQVYQESMRKSQPIDIVVMDLNIPNGLSGNSTASKIREIDSSAKIIVSSGYTDSPEMTNYETHGYQASLEKNFDREKIKAVFEKVLS